MELTHNKDYTILDNDTHLIFFDRETQLLRKKLGKVSNNSYVEVQYNQDKFPTHIYISYVNTIFKRKNNVIVSSTKKRITENFKLGWDNQQELIYYEDSDGNWWDSKIIQAPPLGSSLTRVSNVLNTYVKWAVRRPNRKHPQSDEVVELIKTNYKHFHYLRNRWGISDLKYQLE